MKRITLFYGILYCYSLQQHIFLVFCNDFDTHYRMFAYEALLGVLGIRDKWQNNFRDKG